MGAAKPIFKAASKEQIKNRHKNEINEYSHFYLYAKGWYKRTDVFEDLKAIISNYSGTDVKYLDDNDVIDFLSIIVYPLITTDYFFKEFISRIYKNVSTGNSFKLSLVESMLFYLHFADKNSFGTLAKPDSKILPLSEDGERSRKEIIDSKCFGYEYAPSSSECSNCLAKIECRNKFLNTELSVLKKRLRTIPKRIK
jgi:hypothetical protein